MDAQQREEFASQVRQARAAQGMSQRELADRAGIAPNTLSRIENGKDAQVGSVGKIREFLGIEPMAEALERHAVPQEVEAVLDFLRSRLVLIPQDEFPAAAADLVRLSLSHKLPHEK